MNKKGYCHCETLYTQWNDFEVKGTVIFCHLEITDEGIMAVDVQFAMP